jgi:ABC-2 type transport system ATP-binding protein
VQVVTASHTERQSTLIVNSPSPIHDPAWTVEQLTLEDLVIAYMTGDGTSTRSRRPRLAAAK